VKRFDALVVGGGPAGSTTAWRLADAGASVLLIDKARFPRDKPCGGGVTARAERLCPIDISPVVEEEVDLVELRFRYEDAVVRRASQPVIRMTQRRRLDAHLLDAAREKGVEVHEGESFDPANVAADIVVGADGANGTTARAFDLGNGIVHGVAYEGNVSYGVADRDRYANRAVIELAALDTAHGLSDFFAAWKREGSMDRAIRSTYGITLNDFEKRWQQRTRRRYGALALVSNLTIGGAFVLVVLVPLYFARRHRDRLRMAALVAADEAAERVARESAIEALLHGDDWPGPGDERPGVPRS